MDDFPTGLAERVPPAALLGYLNFSDGRPDARFQRALDDAIAYLRDQGADRPWTVLGDWLDNQAQSLSESGSTAFREVVQARAVARLAFGPLLTAYRDHHRDLLAP